MAASSGRIPRWKHLNDIRAWVAREHGAIVQLAEEAWDRQRFAEGQLVLLTAGPGASAAAARDFVYRLPNLDVPLRVEDVGEAELVIDCGEHDLVRVERYLKANEDRRLRLTLDKDETDKQIKHERSTLENAQADEQITALIGQPPLLGAPVGGSPSSSSTPTSIPASSRSSPPLSLPMISLSFRDRRGPGRRRRSARSSGSTSQRIRTRRS